MQSKQLLRWHWHEIVFRLNGRPGAGGKHRGSKVCLKLHTFPCISSTLIFSPLQPFHLDASCETRFYVNFLWKTTFQLPKPGCLSLTETQDILIGSVFQGQRVYNTYHFNNHCFYIISSWYNWPAIETDIHTHSSIDHDQLTGLTWCELSRVFEAPSLDPLTRLRDCDLDLARDLPGTPLNSEMLPFRPCGIELRLPIELMEPLPEANPFARNTSSSVKSFFNSSSL